MSRASYQQLESGKGGQINYTKRNYDMCMVFKYRTSKDVQFGADGTGGKADASDLQKMNLWKQKRESIVKSLENCGLHVFCYYSRERDEILVKIGANPEKLKDTAHRMKYKLQLKRQYLNAYAEYRHDFPGRPEFKYKDRRILSHMYQNHAEESNPDPEAIFKTIDKIHIIHHIVTSKDRDCAGISVGTMMHNAELKAYFPLHDPDALRWIEIPSNIFDSTFIPKLKNWIMMDENFANSIRDYFGDTVAFYFLFLSFYAKWLVPLALIGVLLQLIDVLSRTPDNRTAIPFCIYVGALTLFLPHHWRRQESKYALNWGTLDLTERLEPCRPEHDGEPRINPVTAQVEPYYPWNRRIPTYMCNTGIIAFSGALVLGVCCLLMYARHQLKGEVRGGILTFQILLAFIVEIMNALLGEVSKKLTMWENHRTASEHNMHRLAKVMSFKFVNSFFVLYYIAFFKHHTRLFNVPLRCMRNDCFLDLQSMLAVFMSFRLIYHVLLKMFWPRAKITFRTWLEENKPFWELLGLRKDLASMSAAEQQSKKDTYDAFADFDETLVTHGYATLFAVSSPWVCSATLLFVIFEIILNAKNVTDNRQRPIPEMARNNEPWSTAFDIYGVIAAFTNVFLLIFTSSQYDGWTLIEKLTFFVFLEHLIFFSRLLLKLVFPEVASSVELLHLKQQSIVHRCLENIKVEQEQDFSMFRDQGQDHVEVFEHDYLDNTGAEDPDDVEPTFSRASIVESYKAFVDGVREAAGEMTSVFRFSRA